MKLFLKSEVETEENLTEHELVMLSCVGYIKAIAVAMKDEGKTVDEAVAAISKAIRVVWGIDQ